MKQLTIFLAITLSLIVSTFPLAAQDTSGVRVPRYKYIQLNYSIGYLRNNLPALNRSLAANGFRPVSQNLAIYSLGASVYAGRFMLTNALMKYDAPEVKSVDSTFLKLGGFGFELSLGYAIIRKNNFRLHPFIGFNANFSNLKIKDKTPLPSFQGFLTGSRREGSITFTNIALNFGVQAERMFYFKKRFSWDCAQNTSYASVGLQAGYLLQLDYSSKAKGHFYNQTVADAPQYGLSGAYVRLLISMGSKIREIKWDND